MIHPPHILVLSDFNLQNFQLALKKAIPGSKVTITPFNQLQQVVLDSQHPLWEAEYDLVMLWATPAAVAAGFPGESAISELRTFLSALRKSQAMNTRFACAEFSSDPQTFYGFQSQNISRRIHEMNLELYDHFRSASQVVLSPSNWFAKAGTKAFDPKLWYLSKTPFHREVFMQAAATIRSYWEGWNGLNRKLLILDLDDTLWGGIVGDDGWENLVLGGHDGAGEAFADFQREIKAIKDNGVILGLVSKNDAAVALEAIRNHPEMILHENDFSAIRINWEDKAKNIAELVTELNLGLDSAVFLDDHPLERERIRSALPMILVPDLPEDKMLYPAFIRSLDCFNSPVLTEEDKARAELYRQEATRRSASHEFEDLDSWLASLNIVLDVEPLSKENLTRAAQLLNKTNQMNLRTRRMSETQLWEWAHRDGNFFWTVKVSDKFGSAGLTGLCSFSMDEDHAFVEDFVLSCRVMGRRIENAMLGILISEAKKRTAKKLVAELLPTEKNKPCREFFGNSRMKMDRGKFSFDPNDRYDIPDYIYLNWEC